MKESLFRYLIQCQRLVIPGVYIVSWNVIEQFSASTTGRFLNQLKYLQSKCDSNCIAYKYKIQNLHGYLRYNCVCGHNTVLIAAKFHENCKLVKLSKQECSEC